jgi:hypothetical protein
MLIRAMMTRIERENMIELSGIGVPMVVTWDIVSIIWYEFYHYRDKPCGTMKRRAALDP